MQINTFETFLAVADCGGFHSAAQQLNITQTTVSARIKSLEKNLGTELFNRGPGGTSLSASGRQFRPYAEQMLRTWKNVTADLSGQYVNRLSLRLGTQLSIWDPLLVDVAIWIESELGKLPFTLNYDHTMNMHEAVRQQLVDIALTNEAPIGAGYGVVKLPAEKMVLVSDNPLKFNEGPLPLLVNLELGLQYQMQLQDILPERSQQHIFLGSAIMGLRYLTKRGGVGYFPLKMVENAVLSRTLYEVTDAPKVSLSCYAVYSRDNPAQEQIKQVLAGLITLRS